MEKHFVVYEKESGIAVSIGSVLADPMPGHLEVHELTSEQAELIYSGQLTWDAESRMIVEVVE